MAELFNITHDAGNLDEYDSTETGGGDLSTGTPGLAGSTARMEAFIDDQGAIYGEVDQTAPVSNEIRFRFYLDPNSLEMAASDSFLILYLLKGTGVPDWYIVQVELKRDAGDTKYQLTFGTATDVPNRVWSTIDISDDEHYVEVHLERGAGDGRGGSPGASGAADAAEK